MGKSKCDIAINFSHDGEIRTLLPDVIQKILEKVRPAPSEKVHYLNIDWFEF